MVIKVLSQFYWSRKLEYLKKTINGPAASHWHKLDHIHLYQVQLTSVGINITNL